MSRVLDIIIPTYDNQEYFDPCVESIIKTGTLANFARLIVVNNGSQKIEPPPSPALRVVKPEKNLGWEGGLKIGVENSDSEFVCFQNDDTLVPRCSDGIYRRMVSLFADPSVGAVGPVSTSSIGWQNIFMPDEPRTIIEVPYLIFFTVVVRRKYLDEVGGIDPKLPGGDDIDLSMRLRKAGYKLLVDPESFLVHYGYKTGERVHGPPDVRGGWNSPKMSDMINKALIQKHGHAAWLATASGKPSVYSLAGDKDSEGDAVRSFVTGSKVVELGVGSRKTVASSIGVDRAPKGTPIGFLDGRASVADVVADFNGVLPFESGSQDCVIARHVIERVLHPISVLKEWARILKSGGVLVLSADDAGVLSGIPMNRENCSSYDSNSLSELMGLLGWKPAGAKAAGNGLTFVAAFEKTDGTASD